MLLFQSRKNCFTRWMVCLLLAILLACRNDKDPQLMPSPAISQEIDSLKKLAFKVPVDSGLAIQQHINLLTKQYGLTDERIRSYCRLGYLIGRTQMNFGRGKIMLDSAADLVKQTGSKKMQPLVDLYYSVLYNGHDDSLTSYYMDKVIPRLDDLEPGDKVTALTGAGNIHAQRNNTESARRYYLQALDIAEKRQPRDLKSEIALHDVLGIINRADKDTLAAIKEWKKALALCNDSIEKLGEIEYFYSNFAHCYIEMGKPDSALPLVKKFAEIVNRNYTNNGSRLLPNIYFAEIALLKEDYNKADSLLSEYGKYIDTLTITSRSLPSDWYIYGYYEMHYRVKKAMGDYAGAVKALESQKQYTSLVEQKKSEDKLLQYDQSLAQKRIDIALAEQKKKAAVSRLVLFSIIFVLLLTIAAGMIIFFRNKKKMEERKLAALHQASVIEKKDLLLKAETTERKRIARELHDELGGTLTVIGMATQNLKRLQMEQITVPLDILERNSTRLSTQINEIVWSLNDNNDTLESLAAYIGRYSRQFLSDTGITYTLHTDTITNYPRRVVIEGYKRRYLFHSIKECLTNIVKHSKASLVTLSMNIEEETLIIQVRDNGTGMPAQAVLKKGNGLENISRNITAIKGTVTWEQLDGTTVTIKVPLRELGKEDENNGVSGMA